MPGLGASPGADGGEVDADGGGGGRGGRCASGSSAWAGSRGCVGCLEEDGVKAFSKLGDGVGEAGCLSGGNGAGEVEGIAGGVEVAFEGGGLLASKGKRDGQ